MKSLEGLQEINLSRKLLEQNTSLHSSTSDCFGNVEYFEVLSRLTDLADLFAQSKSALETGMTHMSSTHDADLLRGYIEYIGSIVRQLRRMDNYVKDQMRALSALGMSTSEERSCLKTAMLEFLQNLQRRMRSLTRNPNISSDIAESVERPISHARAEHTVFYQYERDILTRRHVHMFSVPTHFQMLTQLLQHFTKVNQNFRDSCYAIGDRLTTIIAMMHNDESKVRHLRKYCERIKIEDPHELDRLRHALRKITIPLDDQR